MGKKPTYFDEAEDLYVVDGLTLEAIAARLPVSVTTLSRWKQDGEWEERRRELSRSLADIKRNTLLLRERLVKKALDSLHSQDVYAVARLEAALGRGRGDGPQAGTPAPPGEVEVMEPGEALSLLADALQRRINLMLSQPGEMTLSALKDLKASMELIDALKARYKPESGAVPGGLSEAAVEDIRRQILGVS
jgi:uncharacterized protein YjcR